MSASMEDKLKRRKLDALKRGIHRMSGGDGLPVSTHVVGIGKAGADAIAEMLRGLDADFPKFSALAIDIGDHDLRALRALVANVPPERAVVEIISLETGKPDAVLAALARYPEFLSLEYPPFAWRVGYQPWLSGATHLQEAAGHFERAVAKAIYGLAYYDGARPMLRALRAFAAGIEAAGSQAVIAIVFGLGGGTGSGIAVDLARHLSCGIFGRRLLVTGIGIAPCDGDRAEHRGGRLFPVINELDCLGDEGKNQGVVASCGELFRNPFTAGFIVVPQQHVWERTKDLARTHERVDAEIATLVAARGGFNLWETLRLLNWVAAPSTQHSAARTPWGAKWIHVLGFADAPGPVGTEMAQSPGLLSQYKPEFIEVRAVAADDAEAVAAADRIDAAFHPDVPPQIVGGGLTGSVQFILPCVRKTDLGFFLEARDAYDLESHAKKILDHSLLLEQGVLLSEPSTQLDGMAGESLHDGGGWIAVPLNDMRGDDVAESERRQFGLAS